MQPPFDLEHLRALLRIMERSGLEELAVEEGDCSVRIRREGPAAARPAPPPGPEKVPDGPPASAETLEWIAVRAPIIGLFYRSPAPGEPLFVEEGEWVEVGQTMGLIEAMKIFNEVVAETEGRVARIVAQNQQLVHSGDVLLWINPSAPPDEGDD